MVVDLAVVVLPQQGSGRPLLLPVGVCQADDHLRGHGIGLDQPLPDTAGKPFKKLPAFWFALQLGQKLYRVGAPQGVGLVPCQG